MDYDACAVVVVLRDHVLSRAPKMRSKTVHGATALLTCTVLGPLSIRVVSRPPVVKLKASMLGTVCTYPTKR
jgi:hypothetical protein